MNVQTKHLTFSELPLSQGRKTKTLSVWNHHYGEKLGIVKWHGPWRQYCFFDESTIYSLGCIQDIAAVLQRLKESRKQAGLKERGCDPSD